MNRAFRFLYQCFQILNRKANLIMTQLDDVKAALLQTNSDTNILLTNVAAEVAALNDKITVLQGSVGPTVDLTDVLASIKQIDSMITSATPPAPTPVPPAPPVTPVPPVDPVVPPVSA